MASSVWSVSHLPMLDLLLQIVPLQTDGFYPSESKLILPLLVEAKVEKIYLNWTHAFSFHFILRLIHDEERNASWPPVSQFLTPSNFEDIEYLVLFFLNTSCHIPWKESYLLVDLPCNSLKCQICGRELSVWTILVGSVCDSAVWKSSEAIFSREHLPPPNTGILRTMVLFDVVMRYSIAGLWQLVPGSRKVSCMEGIYLF